MRLHLGWIVVSCVVLAGCDTKSRPTTKTTSTTKSTTGEKAKVPPADVADEKVEAATDKAVGTTADKQIETKAAPTTIETTETIEPSTESAKVGSTDGAAAGTGAAPIDGGVAKLTPENTKIQFVGTHVGDKPDPRTGVFQKFMGAAAVDEATKTLKSVNVEIETGSLETKIDKLNNHLNNIDFFDTREHPKASFVSTKIEPQGDEQLITGNLTLLEATKEITFPATVRIDNAGLSLQANFTIDRTEFGMNRLLEGVEKEVALTVVVGEKTDLPSAPAADQ